MSLGTPAWRTLATLGFHVRPWITVDYPRVPRSVGRFEGEFFDPQVWKPEYPNPAFDNMRPEDAFWAARIVARFSDAAIRAVVAKARHSEAEAADYIAAVLIRRREKVLKTWLTGVNPIVDAALDPSGVLTFENAAVVAQVATPPSGYVLDWSRFDNALGTTERVSDEVTVTAPRVETPRVVLEQSEFISVTIRSLHPAYPQWALPVTVYFRRTADGWQMVGLNRTPLPDTSRTRRGLRH